MLYLAIQRGDVVASSRCILNEIFLITKVHLYLKLLVLVFFLIRGKRSKTKTNRALQVQSKGPEDRMSEIEQIPWLNG